LTLFNDKDKRGDDSQCDKKCTVLYENILICKFMTYTEFKVAITHLLWYRSY